MYELSLSQQNLLSHDFLHRLISEQGLNEFVLINQCLVSQTQLTHAKHTSAEFFENQITNKKQKLLFFTEGLRLQQLIDASLALQWYLKVQRFKVIQVKGLCGFAICAYVEASTDENLSQQLDTVATQLNLELCLFNQVPSLYSPGLLLMDMDSTVIAVECIDEIAELAGVGAQVSKVTIQAMQGELDFADSLRSRVACLAGAEQAILQQVRDALPLMPGVANLIRILKQYNWKVAIASGGFSYFAHHLQDILSLDAVVANELKINQGVLTGELQGAIIDAQAKAKTLTDLAKQWSIPIEQTIAMGDGANDLLMMNAAALGVALHAKPIVREQADIAIRRASLDALLWVLAAQQG